MKNLTVEDAEESGGQVDQTVRVRLLYHFGRLQLPALRVPFEVYDQHLRRGFTLFGASEPRWARGPTGHVFSTICTR